MSFERKPLAEQVRECESRWLQDTIKMAQDTGEATYAMLVGDMFLQGYGAAPSVATARKWWTKAATVKISPSHENFTFNEAAIATAKKKLLTKGVASSQNSTISNSKLDAGLR
eukprot:m.60658 g.60658  ORF g.60658 m.60658 type:complete len:113 (-) comp22867_c0_seq1:250-588(-)